jgi:hypothetical protein
MFFGKPTSDSRNSTEIEIFTAMVYSYGIKYNQNNGHKVSPAVANGGATLYKYISAQKGELPWLSRRISLHRPISCKTMKKNEQLHPCRFGLNSFGLNSFRSFDVHVLPLYLV